MENDRLEQHRESQHATPSATRLGRDWARRRDREEELKKLAPIFERLGLKSSEPSAQEWRLFSQRLAERLSKSKSPLLQRLRDRLTATDSRFVCGYRCILILIALAICAFTAYWFIHEASLPKPHHAFAAAAPVHHAPATEPFQLNHCHRT